MELYISILTPMCIVLWITLFFSFKAYTELEKSSQVYKLKELSDKNEELKDEVERLSKEIKFQKDYSDKLFNQNSELETANFYLRLSEYDEYEKYRKQLDDIIESQDSKIEELNKQLKELEHMNTTYKSYILQLEEKVGGDNGRKR